MPHVMPFGSRCPIYPTNPSFRVTVSFLCPVSILSLAGVVFCISDLLWKYVCQKGVNKICISSPWSGILGVVSEPYSGPWAAPGWPFLEKLSRPKTPKFRSSYQTRAQRGDQATLPSSNPDLSTNLWGSGATQGRSNPCGQPG